jgi:hypothetical protein
MSPGEQVNLAAKANIDHVDARRDSHSSSGQSQLIERGRQVAEELGAHARDEVKAMLMTLLRRVEIRSDRVNITLSRDCLTQLLAGSLDLRMQNQAAYDPFGFA